MFRYVIMYREDTVFTSKPYANKGAAITAGGSMLLKVKEAVSAQLVGVGYRYNVSFEVFPC